MLVLSRKIREQILIPGLNIKITVLSIGGNRVQLGFDAPADVDITRPEAGRPDANRSERNVDHVSRVASLLV